MKNVAEESNSKKRFELKCPRCGYVWTPNPKKWRNTNAVIVQGEPCKVIYCPNCLNKCYLKMEDVSKLLEMVLNEKSTSESR
jgi:phage terminase large subunit GpA-like protein